MENKDTSTYVHTIENGRSFSYEDAIKEAISVSMDAYAGVVREEETGNFIVEYRNGEIHSLAIS